VTPDAVIVLAAIASTPLGLLWVEYCRRRDELMEKRRNCYHRWQPPRKAPIDFVQHCMDCGEQRFTDENGNPVGPRR